MSKIERLCEHRRGDPQRSGKGRWLPPRRTGAVATLLLFSAFGVGGCNTTANDGDAVVVDVEQETMARVPWATYRDDARKGELFIVESDLVFRDEAALRAHYDEVAMKEEPKLAVFKRLSTGYVPTFTTTTRNHIVYCVSDTYSNKSDVVADVAQAAYDWHQIAGVTLSYDSTQDSNCVPSNTAIDFAVLPNNVAGLAGCGASKLMWNSGCPYGTGSAQANGVLSANYGEFSNFPGLTPAGLFRHELGHILGFRHEHPWGSSTCTETPTIASLDIDGDARLTEYDQTSVMHYPQCGGIADTDFVISPLDGLGSREVYGSPPAWIMAITG